MRKLNISFAFLIALLAFQTAYSQQKNWYDSADDRIEQIRKGNFQLKILDINGAPVTDSVEIKLVKHEFKWGTEAPMIENTDQYRWAQAIVRKYYNQAVFGNHFKWPWIEGTRGVVDYSKVNPVLDWAQKNDIDVRGHALLWGGKEGWQMPTWTLGTNLTPQELYAECEKRVRREVKYFKGRILEYDVMNEPTNETSLSTRVGESINWDSFKWAREEDPNAKLYINEYNIMIWGGVTKYKALIQKMLDNGAPIDVIGVQGHMDKIINWQDIKSKLDIIATFNLPIKITEFDMNVESKGMSQADQAIQYARMLRIAFSYPLMEGMVFWGFHDNSVWRAGSGLFDKNRMPKIAADSVYNLIHNKWSTKLAAKPGAAGEVNFRGFYGKYEVTVKTANGNKVFTLPAYKSHDGSVITLSLNNALEAAPKLIDAAIASNSTDILLRFDQAIDPLTIVKGNFLVQKNKFPPIVNAVADNTNNNIIKLSLGNAVAFREQISVIYDKGTLASVSGIKVSSFGPEKVSNPIPGFKSAQMTADGNGIDILISDNIEGAGLTVQDFEVTVNKVATSVTNASIQGSKVVLQIGQSVGAGDFVFVKYKGTSLSSLKGYKLANFTKMAVNAKFYDK